MRRGWLSRVKRVPTGSRGGRKRAAGTRTSSGESKETADQIRSFLRRVKLCLGPYVAIRPANALVRGAFVSKPDAPSRVLSCDRRRGDGVIKIFRCRRAVCGFFDTRAFVTRIFAS